MGVSGTAAIIGAVVAAGSATYSIDQNEQAKRLASQKQDAQRIDMAHAAAKAQQQKDQSTSQAAALAIRQQGRQTDPGASGVGGTILTSPLGAPTQPQQTGGKTLLGV